jgi:hypothetical protein
MNQQITNIWMMPAMLLLALIGAACIIHASQSAENNNETSQQFAIHNDSSPEQLITKVLPSDDHHIRPAFCGALQPHRSLLPLAQKQQDRNNSILPPSLNQSNRSNQDPSFTDYLPHAKMSTIPKIGSEKNNASVDAGQGRRRESTTSHAHKRCCVSRVMISEFCIQAYILCRKTLLVLTLSRRKRSALATLSIRFNKPTDHHRHQA